MGFFVKPLCTSINDCSSLFNVWSFISHCSLGTYLMAFWEVVGAVVVDGTSSTHFSGETAHKESEENFQT